MPPALGARVLVYGATSSGVMAAVAVARNGGDAVLLEPGDHVGGMSAGGLGATDTGNAASIGGLAREFYTRVGSRYGRSIQYDLEPHVAEAVFREMLQHFRIRVVHGARIARVTMNGTLIHSVTTTDDTAYQADVYIDASYEGDLMALAGVSHTVGREGNAEYGETLNGVRIPKSPGGPTGNQLDPYVAVGIPSSGLLPHVTTGPAAELGAADRRVQAYTYRLCLTTDPGNRVAMRPPEPYDASEFELHARWAVGIPLGGRAATFKDLVNIRPIPGGKWDLNSAWFVSTDLVGGSDRYPEGDEATRQEIRAAHERYVRGYLHFLATSPRIAQVIRDEASSYGLCADEFLDNRNWPHQLYVREARRMVGALVMTERHVFGGEVVTDPVALGSYPADSHYTQRLDVGGVVQVEGSFYVRPPAPYGVSYRALTPRAEQVSNLIVPVALSATHVAYGSLRMEPVYMMLGHAAGTAAVLSAAAGVSVQALDYGVLGARLVEEGQILSWVGVTLTADSSSPRPAGTATTFMAVAHNAANPQFRFWLRPEASGQPSLVQDYGPEATWTMPATTPPGKYSVIVHVRRDASTSYEARAEVAFEIQASAP